MNPRDLKNAFPPVPEMCRDALMSAVSSVQEEERPVKHAFRLAVVMAILMITLTSVAYAVTRPGVLDWLLGGREAAPWLEEAAQTVKGSATEDGVTVSVTSLVYDGKQLVLSYEAAVSDPTQAVLVTLDQDMLLGGEPARLTHPSVVDAKMVPSPHLDFLPVQRNPILRGAWSGTLPELSGTVEAEVTFLIYRPEKGFAFVDDLGMLTDDLSDMDAETRAEYQDCRDTIAALTNAVIVDGDPEPWAADGYTLVDHSGMLMDNEHPHLTETRMPVRFQFQADVPVVYDFASDGYTTLDDATLHIEEFRLSPLSTSVRVQLIPNENTEEAARLLADTCGQIALTDESSKPVEYASMDYMFDSWPRVYEKDGQWVCEYWFEMPGLQTLPGGIGLTVESGDLIHFPLGD